MIPVPEGTMIPGTQTRAPKGTMQAGKTEEVAAYRESLIKESEAMSEAENVKKAKTNEFRVGKTGTAEESGWGPSHSQVDERRARADANKKAADAAQDQKVQEQREKTHPDTAKAGAAVTHTDYMQPANTSLARIEAHLREQNGLLKQVFTA